MRKPLVLLLGMLNGVPAVLARAQTAHQGVGEVEFHSPMILETSFLAAYRWHWKAKEESWITNDEYRRLRTLRCEKISISSLEMYAREIPGDNVEVRVRVSLLNPDRNDDKEVELLFEVINEIVPGVDKVEGSFTLDPVKVKEGATVTRTTKATLPQAVLKTDPITKLRITMTTRDY